MNAPQPDQAKMPTWMIAALAVLGLALIVADYLLHAHDYFHIAENPFAYPVLGLVGFLAYTAFALLWRALVSRPETYYGDDSVGGEDETLAGSQDFVEAQRRNGGNKA